MTDPFLGISAHKLSMPNCKYFGRCGGCPSHQNVSEPFFKGTAVYSPTGHVRDRVDLIWERQQDKMCLGLYELGTKTVVDLDSCPMMSEPLEKFFKKFRQKAPPIQKGSVRLRVSPNGEYGVWLDFANADVKKLFDERDYLKWLSSFAFVEVGQRRKTLVWKDELPKLTDPTLKPWFQTYGPGQKPIPLYGPVGGFSQPGFASNQALVGSVVKMANASGVSDWLELFCGNGNFTLSLAAHGFNLEAVEMDELAIAGLKLSSDKILVHRADVYLQSQKLPAFGGRGLLVDPPRAGLRETFKLLEQSSNPPEAIIYVSCFTDTFNKDTERLIGLGFKLESLERVDQFPYSPHTEWISLFKKQGS